MEATTDPSALFGYAHPLYSASLAEFGTPVLLPQSGGWLLKRTIAGESAEDAIGSYPLFTCANWPGLQNDLDGLGTSLVTVALVADPFGAYDLPYLRQCFPDVMVPFKEHFVIDLEAAPYETVSAHHRRYARTALRNMHVDVHERPANLADTWCRLYGDLVRRLSLRGIQAFSRRAFEIQLQVPGAVLLIASRAGEPIAAQIWFWQGDVCHSHLVCTTAQGKRLRAAFALHWTAIDYFCGRTSFLNLGGAAGSRIDSSNGLARFKRGWSNTTRVAHFCGRVLNRAIYDALIRDADVAATNYFPRYRHGEFQ